MSEPAWPHVQDWLRAAENGVEVLPPDVDQREETRTGIGVSLDSALGAVIQETGGILVDQGWLRILGSGSPRIPRRARGDRKWVLVADDVVGGFFALHPPEGKVSYLAPDTLSWEPLDIGYSAWLRWCVTRELGSFYADYRARGWEERIRALEPHQCFMIVPLPWTTGPSFYERSWKNTPVNEAYGLSLDFQAQLGG